MRWSLLQVCPAHRWVVNTFVCQQHHHAWVRCFHNNLDIHQSDSETSIVETLSCADSTVEKADISRVILAAIRLVHILPASEQEIWIGYALCLRFAWKVVHIVHNESCADTWC
jgi:hypothetical protein